MQTLDTSLLNAGLSILIAVLTALIGWSFRRASRRDAQRENRQMLRDQKFEEYFQRVSRLEILVQNMASVSGQINQTLLDVALIKEQLTFLKAPLLEINSRFALFEKEMKASWAAHDRNKEEIRELRSRVNFILGKLLLIKKEAEAAHWKLGDWPLGKEG
jgi:hypothetical protein